MSELALIKEQTLTNIGDAIREKTSTTDLIMPKDMPAKIRSISSGGGVDLKSLRNKQYSIITDQANMHNQYIEYKLDNNGIDNFSYKSTDNADHLYASNGLIGFIIELKPMEGYKVGSAKVHSDGGMFDDTTIDSSSNKLNDYLIGGDIHVTEVTPATKASGIDFENYMSKWYNSTYSSMTELTETTKNIITDPSIKAISDRGSNPSMDNMFATCLDLISIPKILVDSSDVVSMNRMFSDCNKLEKIDLSGLNTSKVNDMSRMFDNCNQLKSVDMSTINTTSITTYGNIFNYCNNLEVLDLSGSFIIKSAIVDRYDSLINSCSKLKYIIFNDENTSLLTNSAFVNWFGSFGNTDTLTILIPGDQAKLDSIKSQIDQSQYSTYHIEIDLISNYTITKPGDGTVDVKKNEIVSEWKPLTLSDDIIYTGFDTEELNGKYIKLRITGTSSYQADNHTFNELEIPLVLMNHRDAGVIKISKDQMEVFKAFFMNSAQMQTSFPQLWALINSGAYDHACMLMIANGNSYSIHTVISNQAGQCGVCKNGVESLMPNIKYINYFHEFEVTKLEYKVIEASDIKPTDYKLNFD